MKARVCQLSYLMVDLVALDIWSDFIVVGMGSEYGPFIEFLTDLGDPICDELGFDNFWVRGR